MKSKFLKLCEDIRKKINEQNEVPEEPATTAPDDTEETLNTNEQPAAEVSLSDDQSSELPVASNKEIIEVLQSIKDFYSKEKKLTDSEIERLKMLPNTVDDKNVKDIINNLNKIFNPTKTIDTNPQNIPDTRFES